mmetsp:Transcript_1780/g.2470  ORF Transcript_1780/g.2470 Transcript_1780/m.2470 type:complete len:86 (+) Transcript_1780:108-365(+)
MHVAQVKVWQMEFLAMRAGIIVYSCNRAELFTLFRRIVVVVQALGSKITRSKITKQLLPTSLATVIFLFIGVTAFIAVQLLLCKL